MPLPIAVGGVSLSSEKLKGPYQPPPSKSAIDQNSKLDVSEPRPCQSVTWAVCPRNEWQARTVVSFFDEDVERSQANANEQQHETESTRKRMAEIRVQISPLARALSPKNYRETSYHLELFTYMEDEDNEEDVQDDYESDYGSHSDESSADYEEDSFSSDTESGDDHHIEDKPRQEETHRQPQVIFSQDRRHLVVLLFHTKRTHSNSQRWKERIQQHQSAIVVFQLRKPKSTTNSSLDIRSRIPIPSYIAKTTQSSGGNNSIRAASDPNDSVATISPDIGGSPVVATHPKFVTSCNDITAICRLCGKISDPVGIARPSSLHSAFFLAMKNDGNLNWVDAHSAQIIATAELPEIRSNGCYVSSMNASPASTTDSGVVAMVIASSSPSPSSLSRSSQSTASHVTDYDGDDDENDDITYESIESAASSSKTSDVGSTCQQINRGDCVFFRWSAHSTQSSGVTGGTRPGNPPTILNVRFQSVWFPPTRANQKDDLRVTSVCFGSLPSVVCVVYTHSNERQVSLGPRQKLAQILTISDNKTKEGTEGFDLVPTVSLYLSPDQVEQAPSVANFDRKKNGSSNEDSYCDQNEGRHHGEYELKVPSVFRDDEAGREKNFMMTVESRLVGIHHDPRSDSFLVSSIFRGNRDMKDHWVGCVWNWRANAIGWMIQHTIPPLRTMFRKSVAIHWSRLYFARDGGPYLVYMNSALESNYTHDSENSKDKNSVPILNTSKRFVSAAMLSPPSSSDPTLFSERSSLLLCENHVAFPHVVRKDSDVTVRELDWRLSALPLSYTASQGSPSIAAMGAARAKSIAVASTHGVCVMDTHHQKWRQFGSPSEERAFSVLAMTWWEGCSTGEKDDESDDLLVAITQTRSGEKFLSCWTSKRLDLMHQLMDTPDQEWKPGESQDPEPSWGIPLPKDVRANCISLLPEPEPAEEISKSNISPRRAIALIYSPDFAAEEDNYLLFRLQVFRNKVPISRSNEPYITRRPFYVMARKAIQGRLNRGNFSGSITSVFIASASFHFDLRQSTKKKKKQNFNDAHDVDFVATLGIARTPGGMQALSVFQNGERSDASLTNFEVSKYQLSDLISCDLPSYTANSPITKLVWTIELLNGSVISWATPSFVGSISDAPELLRECSFIKEEMDTDVHISTRSRGLDRPSLVCIDAMNKTENWFLGTICDVGTVSDWAIQSTFGCQFDISLGSVPLMIFGCVLRCGQNSQKYARDQVEAVNHRIFSSESKSFSQSPFKITPPAFAIPVYTLLLEAAYIQMEINAIESLPIVDDLKNRLQRVKRQVHYRLMSAQNTDSSMMTLRLLTFRSLEMVAKWNKKNSKEQSESTIFDLRLSHNLLQTVVDTARICTSDLQFASLFLEVGRQSEPSNLQHLFPLPSSLNNTEIELSSDVLDARSVVDLFNICIEKGSLAASSSALPLLMSKGQARYYCELLLDEAIDNFIRNSSPNQCNFDSTEEERRVLGDIFRFGMKLEDADFYEEKMIAESQDGRRGTDATSIDTVDRSLSSQIFAPESPQKRNLICNLTATNSVLNYFVPSSVVADSETQRMEEAIRREASSFIKRSLDDPVLEFAMLPDWDDSFGSRNANMTDTNGVAYLVGDALLDLLHTETSSNNWKVITAFAKLILQEGVESPSSYDLFVEVTDKAQPFDLLSIMPESYDVENGLERNLSAYIEEEIESCSRQITSADADYIIGLSLLLIDRLKLLPISIIHDQVVLELGLAFIILVASDVSGRSQYIHGILEEDSLINKCYKRLS